MAPSVEQAVEEAWGARMVSGRVVIQEVRSKARSEYVDLVARIGATPCGGRTLRHMLGDGGGTTRWWFLGITEKDCVWDDDTIYTTILRATAVTSVMARYRVSQVSVHGGPAGFAAVLRASAAEGASAGAIARLAVVGVAARLALIGEYIGLWWLLRSASRPAPQPRDVLLQGYWDWSVFPDGRGALRDRYFARLPEQLANRRMSVGWLASCEAAPDERGMPRSTRAAVEAARAYPDVTILERYLSPSDIIAHALNLRDAIRITRFVRDPRFRSLCRVGEIDLYAVVSRRLLQDAWAPTVCRLQLVATAVARACRELRPRVVLTFLELFLRARAFYAGAAACGHRPRAWAAQHAGYSSDKTLGVFDPEVEIQGAPDGYGVPAPDGIFVMGDLSKRIWEANLGAGRVMQSGGLRYEDVRIDSRRPRVATMSPLTILLVGGMNEAAELDVCDAVVAAAEGLAAVRVRWRDHPSYRFSERPAFRRFRESIEVTAGTIDEDLDAADLVIYTHSGVGEEAFLRGIPTWQWLWPGFNTSPFLDVPAIRAFTSVRALRTELASFISDPAPYQPALEAQQRVLRECFGPTAASVRIADAVQQMIGAVRTPA